MILTKNTERSRQRNNYKPKQSPRVPSHEWMRDLCSFLSCLFIVYAASTLEGIEGRHKANLQLEGEIQSVLMLKGCIKRNVNLCWLSSRARTWSSLWAQNPVQGPSLCYLGSSLSSCKVSFSIVLLLIFLPIHTNSLLCDPRATVHACVRGPALWQVAASTLAWDLLEDRNHVHVIHTQHTIGALTVFEWTICLLC